MLFAVFLGVFSAAAEAASWTTTTPLPDAYDGHALVYSSGRLYHTGGISLNGGVLDGIRVFFAPVSPSGTVGAWTPGPVLPEAVFYHAGAAANGFVYVLGGYHYTDAAGMVVSDAVYYAKVNADGSLGAWQSGARLPQPLLFLSAAVWNGRIYATGGTNGSSLSDSVYSAVVNKDGSLGSWTTQKPLPVPVYTHTEVSNGTLYVLGGAVNGGADIQNAVYFAKINADGTLADWTAGSPLPQPVSNLAAILANGRVFVTGGWTGTSPSDAVESSAVGSDGSLGLWSPETSMPLPLYLHSAATDGSYVYVSGGVDTVAIRAEVYSMPLPPPPPPSDVLPPRTSLAFSGPQFGGLFISTSTLAALSAVDDRNVVGDGLGAGVASTQWALDAGNFAAYAAPIQIRSDGAHAIRFMSTDLLGHAEAVRASSAAVDGTPPVSSLSIGTPQAVLATGETIVGSTTLLAVSAVDPVVNGAASGVALTLAGVDGSALAASTSPFVLPAADGPHSIAMASVDNVGNAEAVHSATLYRDSAPPLTSLALSSPAFAAADGGAPFAGAGTLVSFTAQDPGLVAAGVNHSEYALDGGSVANYTGAFGLPEGAHALAYRSVDNVGNAEAWRTVSYRSDLTLPQSSMSWTGAPTPNTAFALSAVDPVSNGVASGVSRILYSVDGGADLIYARPFSLALGSHTVSYAATDNAGNVEARNSAAIAVGPADDLPPRTTLAFGSPSFGAVPFISPATPATLAAVDDALLVGDGRGLGVASTQWSLDGGSFTVYAAPIRIAGDGAHSIRYLSVDLAGNTEAVRVSSAAVDGTAPVSSLSIGSPQAVLATGEIIVASATLLAVSAVDPSVNGAASGVALALAGVDGAPLAASNAPFVLPAADGAHAVSMQAVDNVGNKEAVHVSTVYRDSTPPVTTLAFSSSPFAGPSGPIYSVATVMTFAALDPASGGVAAGVNRTEYALDGGATTVYAGAFGAAEGAHSLSYRSVDNVGNAEAARTVSFAIDATPPQTTLTVDGGTTLFGADLLTTAAALSLSATDPVSNGTASGVARVVYSVDGGADQAYAAPFHLNAGAHTLSYGAVDNAGNAETRSVASLSVETFLADALAGIDAISLTGSAGVTGSVRTNGAFTGDRKSFVTGDVAGMTVTLTKKSTVSGTITQGRATLALPSYDLSAARTWAKAHNNNAALPPRQMSGGALILDGGDSAALPAGDYYLTGLRLRGRSSLTVSGRVNVFLDGPLTVRAGSSLNGSGDAGNLWIVSADSSRDAYEASGDNDDQDAPGDDDGNDQASSIFLNGKTRAAFNLYAPLGALRAQGKGEYAGRVLVQTASLAGKALQPSTTSLPPAQFAAGPASHSQPPAARAGAGTANAGHAAGRDSAVASYRLDPVSPSVAARGASAPTATAPSGPAPALAAASQPAAPREVKHLAPAAAPSGAGTAGPGRSGGRDAAVASSALAFQAPACAKSGAVLPPSVGLAAALPNAGGPGSRTAHSRLPSFSLAARAAFSMVGGSGSAVHGKDGTGVVIPAGAVSGGLGVTVSPPNTGDAVQNSLQAAVQSRKGMIAAAAAVQYGPEGTQFAVPVTLEMPYNRAALPAGISENDLAVHYWNAANGDWEKLASSVDTQNQIVRAQTMHFSLYQVFSAPAAPLSAAPLANGDPAFTFHDAYVFPNPVRGAGAATIRVQVGLADSVEVHVYDLTGRRVHSSSDFTLNTGLDDGNGKGAQYTYDHVWNVSGVGSGVYMYVITAKKAGQTDVHRSGKIGVVK